MKVTKRFVLSLAAIITMGLLMAACTHPPVKGLEQGRTNMGPRPWESLFSVTIKKDGTWVIAGSKGLILTTSDEGKTWHRRSLLDRDLYSLRFSSDEKVAWVVGEDGVVFRSTDGGKTWERQKAPSHDRYLKVAVINDQSAIVVGSTGAIMFTKDGGQTWNMRRFHDLTFFDVWADNNNAWTVGEFQTVLHSSDGGDSWKVQAGGDESKFQLGPYFAVDFITDQTGYTVGLNGMINSTTDGGKTWQNSKLPVNRAMYVAAEQSPQALWLAGAEGTFIHAKLPEQSTQWPVINPTFNDISDLAIRGKVEVAVGLNGTVVYSNDSGEHWQTVSDNR